MRQGLVLLVLMLLLTQPGGAARSQTGGMQRFETRYYVLHTDLDDEQAREAAIRMTRMAEEYARRTADFGSPVRKKMPFYLFANAEDYYATGAPRASSGRYNGTSLLAVAEDFGPKTWHIVQHEGFHQFADAAMGAAKLPPWVNEGLAEYFGEAVFTGDGYITGGIPQWRLERIRKRFKTNEFKSLREMMDLPLSAWNNELSLVNYDQAWAMVQFLAHGENGRYQKAFSAFLGHVGRGSTWQVAWQRTFGDTRGFEQRWRDWWTSLPDNPTADIYAQATVAMLASFLARASSQGQTFDTFDAFADALAAGQVRHHSEDWLPPSLARRAVSEARTAALASTTFSLVQGSRAGPGAAGKLAGIECILADGTRITGRYTIRQGRVVSVTAAISPSR